MERPFACVIDRMSVVQIMKGGNLTFEGLPNQMLASIFRSGIGSEHIDVVFDEYQHLSITGTERAMRGRET